MTSPLLSSEEFDSDRDESGTDILVPEVGDDHTIEAHRRIPVGRVRVNDEERTLFARPVCSMFKKYRNQAIPGHFRQAAPLCAQFTTTVFFVVTLFPLSLFFQCSRRGCPFIGTVRCINTESQQHNLNSFVKFSRPLSAQVLHKMFLNGGPKRCPRFLCDNHTKTVRWLTVLAPAELEFHSDGPYCSNCAQRLSWHATGRTAFAVIVWLVMIGATIAVFTKGNESNTNSYTAPPTPHPNHWIQY